jgi:TRAP-type C4-dicarboxylate transport system permease small subunit
VLARLERTLVAVNRALLGLMMLAMTALVFTNVVTRYGFGFSIAWVEEVSLYLMIWIAYLGAGLAMREGRHVAIETFQDRLPAGVVPWVRAAVGAAVLAFLACLAALGFEFARFAMDQETPVLEIPAGIPYLAIPIGAVVFGLHLLLVFGDYDARRLRLPGATER